MQQRHNPWYLNNDFFIDNVHKIGRQALEKWGNWGQPGTPALANGQSEIKFTKLEFARPHAVANQYAPDEGYTGELPRRLQGLYSYPCRPYPAGPGMIAAGRHGLNPASGAVSA